MDIRGFDRAHAGNGTDPTDAGVGEATVNIGGDERRMHVRAYNHWVSLLKGRDFPSVEHLDPERIADFGAHSVLLDFTDGTDDPTISFLGRALREECALDHTIARISEVPARSLLSRLTDHYLQIIANRAPIGFEAEFVGTRGHNTMYRGILMPFSSDGVTIDFIYGVINWKEIVGEAVQAQLAAELATAVRSMPKITPTATVWADGPSATHGMEAEPAHASSAAAAARVRRRRATPDAALAARVPLASVSLDLSAQPGDLVVLVARAGASGVFDVIGAVSDDPRLVARAARALG